MTDKSHGSKSKVTAVTVKWAQKPQTIQYMQKTKWSTRQDMQKDTS